MQLKFYQLVCFDVQPYVYFPTPVVSNSLIQDSGFIHHWVKSSQGLHILCTNCLSCSFPVNANIIIYVFLDSISLLLAILKKDLQGLLWIVSCFSLSLICRGLIKNNSHAQEKKPFSIDGYSWNHNYKILF